MLVTGKAKAATILSKKDRPGHSSFSVRGSILREKENKHEEGFTEWGRSPGPNK